MKKLFAFIALGLLFFESLSSVLNTNQVDGLNNIIHYGQYNKISGDSNEVLGHLNKIQGQGNAALGLGNQLKGDGNLVAGVGNTVGGKGNLVGGHGNIVIGPDASEQEKALINQKMMSLLAQRGLNGIPSRTVANNQISDSARESSAVLSNSKENENNNLPPQALQTLPDPEPVSPPPSNENSIRAQGDSEPVQKIEETVLPKTEVKEKILPEVPEAYVVQTKQTQHDYNLANTAEAMPVDDLTFNDQSQSKARDNKQNDSPKNQAETQVDPKPFSNVVVQTVGQTQQEPKKFVSSLPVQPVQPKTQILVKPEVVAKPEVKPQVKPEVKIEVKPEVKPEPKPVEPVKIEPKVVRAPKETPVAQQPTIPMVAQQNKIQAQQNQIQAQQNRPTTSSKVEKSKQDSGFKFYVNNGSTTESSSKNTVQASSRYSRATRNFDQVPQVVTVPPARSSNLRKEEAPKIQSKKPVEKPQSSNSNAESFRIVQSSSVPRDAQESKQPVSSTVRVNSRTSSNRAVQSQSQNFGFSSTDSGSSSSSNGAVKQKRDAVMVQAPVVVTTTSTVVRSSVPSSMSSAKPVVRTANDVASSYISSGNPNVVILSGNQSLGGPRIW